MFQHWGDKLPDSERRQSLSQAKQGCRAPGIYHRANQGLSGKFPKMGNWLWGGRRTNTQCCILIADVSLLAPLHDPFMHEILFEISVLVR